MAKILNPADPQLTAKATLFDESEWLDHLQQIFSTAGSQATGIGLADLDDAACIAWSQTSTDPLLAISTDCIQEGVHFPRHAPPDWLAQRLIKASISDLYAVGAQPQYILLSLVDKCLERDFYQAFARHLHALCRAEGLILLGGNTSSALRDRGMTVTTLGHVKPDQIVRRSTAKAGQYIGLSHRTGHYAMARQNENWSEMALPDLRACAEVVRQYSSACIDVSDGLAVDLNRLLVASGIGGRLWQDQVLAAEDSTPSSQPNLDFALYGGEDYVLCFTIEEESLAQAQQQWPIEIIGQTSSATGLYLGKSRQAQEFKPIALNVAYQHFTDPTSSQT